LEGDDHALHARTEREVVESAVRVGLTRAHGVVGGALAFETCGAIEDEGSCVLRVRERDVRKLWSALTMMSEMNERACSFEVLAIEGSLVRLAGGT